MHEMFNILLNILNQYLQFLQYFLIHHWLYIIEKYLISKKFNITS